MTSTPEAEWAIDESLVIRLLEDQHPDLSALPITLIDQGWDNTMFRLGDELVVRMPRRTLAAELILHEHRWLPLLAGVLPLPIPAPLRMGTAALGYPCSWSIQSWFPGRSADQAEPPATEVRAIATFLRALHVGAPAEAPENPFRGGPLSQREPFVEGRLARLAGFPGWDEQTIRQVWSAALKAPIDVPEVWIHGDLHPRNVLVNEGFVSAVIDWGDLTHGDPATDLAAFWMLFSEPSVQTSALRAYGSPSGATVSRALGWAVVFGSMFLETGLSDHPQHAVLGEKILGNVARFWLGNLG